MSGDCAPVVDGIRLRLRRTQVLVVDDNRDAAESLEMLWSSKATEVVKAYDVADAVKIAERVRPDVILMDVDCLSSTGMKPVDAFATTCGAWQS